MKTQIKKFQELTPDEFYKIFKLRFDVFVIEQKCIYDEFDNIDYDAIHMFIDQEEEVLAYLRIYKKSEDKAAIGRLVVKKEYRKKGMGKEIFKQGIEYIKSNFKVRKIEIHAQERLKKLYTSFGFKQISDVYDDEGILHVDMILEI